MEIACKYCVDVAQLGGRKKSKGRREGVFIWVQTIKRECIDLSQGGRRIAEFGISIIIPDKPSGLFEFDAWYPGSTRTILPG